MTPTTPPPAELREIAERATQGDWGVSGGRHSNMVYGHAIYAGPKQETIALVAFDQRTGEGFSDAKFIGACKPAVVLSLLDALDAKDAEIARLQDLLFKYMNGDTSHAD